MTTVVFLSINYYLLQIKFYKVTAVPVLMNGSKNWSLNRSDKWKIEAAEMKFLRPIAGYTFWDKNEVAT